MGVAVSPSGPDSVAPATQSPGGDGMFAQTTDRDEPLQVNNLIRGGKFDVLLHTSGPGQSRKFDKLLLTPGPGHSRQRS